MSQSVTQNVSCREYFSTGIDGLDFVLMNGVKSRSGCYSPVMIKGIPGAGKTILALQIAANYFNKESKKKRPVAYFSIEQSAQSIHETLGQFSWGKTKAVQNAVFTQEDADAPLGRIEPKVPFLIDQIPIRTIKSLIESEFGDMEPGYKNDFSDRSAPKLAAGVFQPTSALVEHIDERVESIRGCELIVIDSLTDSISDYEAGSFEFRRTLFHSLCEVGQRWGALVLVLIEKTEASRWRDFVVDMVIDLGRKDDRRYLKVEKSRFQPTADGLHEMRILPETGIEIYPTPTSIMRKLDQENEKRKKKDKSSERNEFQKQFFADASNETISFCTCKDFDKMFGQANRIRAGSSILLYGPDGTKKNAVATRFLHQGLVEDGKNSRVLYLKSSGNVEVAKDMIRRHLDPKKLIDKSFDKTLGRFIVRRINLHIESLAELANHLRQLICFGEHPISRVVFEDIAAVDEGAKTLVDLLSSFNVTALFVQSTGVNEHSNLRELFDTFLQSSHLRFPDGVTTKIGYKAIKVNGASDANRSWHLRFSASTGKMNLTDDFSEYTESYDGRLERLPIHLDLYGENPGLVCELKDEVKTVFGDDYEQRNISCNTFDNRDAEGFFDDILNIEVSAERSETRIVNLDEYWIPHLVQRGKLEVLDELFEKKFFSDFQKMAVERGRFGGRSYGIPHRIDFGVYAIRKDVLTDEFISHCGLDPAKTDWTWEELSFLHSNLTEPTAETRQRMKFAELEAQEKGRKITDESDPTMYPFLGIRGSFEQSFTCFLLECLWPELFGDKNKFKGFGNETVVAKINELLKLFRNRKEQDDWVQKTAIVQRHWVVTYEQLPAEDKAKLQIIRTPCFSPGQPSISMCGEWYLGILKGSLGLGGGKWAIRALTRDAASSRAQAKKIGLSPKKNSFERSRVETFKKIYATTRSRKEIPNFGQLRPVFHDYFVDRIFGAETVNSTAIGEMLKSLDQICFEPELK